MVSLQSSNGPGEAAAQRAGSQDAMPIPSKNASGIAEVRESQPGSVADTGAADTRADTLEEPDKDQGWLPQTLKNEWIEYMTFDDERKVCLYVVNKAINLTS